MLAARLRELPERYVGSWNFGPSTQDVRTVHEVASVIIKHIGRGSIDISESVHNLHEARLLQLNCDKAHQLLEWYPRWSVDKTFEATAEWYQWVLNGNDAQDVTRKQLYEYFPELS